MEVESTLTAINYYAQAAKYIGVGMACLGMGFLSLALGNIFNSYLSGSLRNPSAADGQQVRVLVFAAIAESLGIFLLLVVLMLLFVV
ncbi:ATP synthase C chain [Liberibacter crescens BT-1]|uniref:ATP synthase F(0) sector subunit c n=1 Tax=Liberibacter crescens (strain BT-1) TaxID=1215343 RepID=L0EWH0_LIBCB|nr:F0F1 ATP synthase subunit C [Liberibacter crescens]AGA64726.1 ATP synthase C chain [Liberibacter crescens BT-1]